MLVVYWNVVWLLSPHVRSASSALGRYGGENIKYPTTTTGTVTSPTTSCRHAIGSLLRAGAAAHLPSSLTSTIPIEYKGNDDHPQKVLIVMDGFCSYHTGYMIRRAHEIQGVAIIHVLSDYLKGYMELTVPEDSEQIRMMQTPTTPQVAIKWKELLGTTRLVAVYCESDSGLADAEVLRELLQVDCRDDPDVLESRRNKYTMHQAVEKAGLIVARQQLCYHKNEATSFAQDLLKTDGRVVCKPFRGVASECVCLCTSLQEVEAAWDKITESSVFGSAAKHDTVLVQEFLNGVEYAVDVVSRKGEHKVAAVWRYDKRKANGAAFCYFQTELVDMKTDPNVEAVCKYIKRTLDALGVKFGIAHCETIVVQDRGPILIEVNCRQHNMDFGPLVMACLGYNIFDMVLTAFFGEDTDWMRYDDMPDLRAYGSMVHLVCYAEGRLKQCHHLEDIVKLPSVFDCEVYNQFQTAGEVIEPTVDIRTDAGWVQLINQDRDEIQRDFQKIVEYMPTMFETYH